MRKQHLFLLLSIVSLILLYWFPIWMFKLGLLGESQVYTHLDLLGLSLDVTTPPQSSIIIPDIKPSYWYLNSVGIVLSIVVCLIAFLHFGDLKIQRRWGTVAIISIFIQVIFTFLQIKVIIDQYQKALQTDLNFLGLTTFGDFYFSSSYGEIGLYLVGLSTIFILLAIIFIHRDLKLVSSMNRLR